MFHCAYAGEVLISAHRSALNAYAYHQWRLAFNNLSPALVGAACIGQFNMDAEPMLEKIGTHSPALPGVDMGLLQSPIKRQFLAQKLSQRIDSNKE